MGELLVKDGIMLDGGQILTPRGISPDGLNEMMSLDSTKSIVGAAVRHVYEQQLRHNNEADITKIGIWVIRLGLTRVRGTAEGVVTETAFWDDLRKQEDSGVFYDSGALRPDLTAYWYAVENAGFKTTARKQIPGGYTWLLAGLAV
ncbi:hypothetical protein KC878_01805 [Candidatus Saccharibacteria bacterium]|nr:hypothetical protein [Candidatus Saccharibacteria bacterium]MCB9821614.1 hypothetical protein [Candidatus Nomurabacteria bacterium]